MINICCSLVGYTRNLNAILQSTMFTSFLQYLNKNWHLLNCLYYTTANQLWQECNCKILTKKVIILSIISSLSIYLWRKPSRHKWLVCATSLINHCANYTIAYKLMQHPIVFNNGRQKTSISCVSLSLHIYRSTFNHVVFLNSTHMCYIKHNI